MHIKGNIIYLILQCSFVIALIVIYQVESRFRYCLVSIFEPLNFNIHKDRIFLIIYAILVNVC